MGFTDLFFKNEEPAKKVETAQQVQQKAPAFPPPTVENPVQNMTTVGVPDEKFVSMLEGVIADNNRKGLDYFEFKQAIEKMKALPIDEATKFMTVYSTFEMQGCTRETLLNAIDQYIGLIKKEQEGFEAEMAVSFKENVESKKAKVEEARAEIVTLNGKIEELNNFVMTGTQEAQQEEMKLRMVDANFKQSVQRVLSVMTTDKEKITNYIK